MLKASVLYFNQWYFELINCLSSEVVVDSHILEMQYLLIIGSVPTVRFCFRNIFSQEMLWFLVLLIHEAVWTETAALPSVPCSFHHQWAIGYVCPLQLMWLREVTCLWVPTLHWGMTDNCWGLHLSFQWEEGNNGFNEGRHQVNRNYVSQEMWCRQK